jgi:hypothetical protein
LASLAADRAGLESSSSVLVAADTPRRLCASLPPARLLKLSVPASSVGVLMYIARLVIIGKVRRDATLC